MIPLPPCPGCRGEELHPVLSTHVGWRIVCFGCSMMGPVGVDEPDAGRRWNGLSRRTAEACMGWREKNQPADSARFMRWRGRVVMLKFMGGRRRRLFYLNGYHFPPMGRFMREYDPEFSRGKRNRGMLWDALYFRRPTKPQRTWKCSRRHQYKPRED